MYYRFVRKSPFQLRPGALMNLFQQYAALQVRRWKHLVRRKYRQAGYLYGTYL